MRGNGQGGSGKARALAAVRMLSAETSWERVRNESESQRPEARPRALRRGSVAEEQHHQSEAKGGVCVRACKKDRASGGVVEISCRGIARVRSPQPDYSVHGTDESSQPTSQPSAEEEKKKPEKTIKSLLALATVLSPTQIAQTLRQGYA